VSLGKTRRLAPFAWCLCAIALASCAAKVPALPSGPGTPFPEAATAYTQATEQCRGVRTLSAELRLSGRAGRTKLGGRILAGFADPAQVRLEAPAPFGRPVFVLVARGEDATLVLYKANRVLRGAPPDAIVDALAGVSLDPDQLRSALDGCGFAAGRATTGRTYPGEWATVDADGATNWLRRVDGAWRLMASARGPLEIRYDDFSAGRPSTVRVRSTPSATAGAGATATDLTIRLSQVELNTELGAEVFQVDVPRDAVPITLEELRGAGPLGSGGEIDHLPQAGTAPQ
jgi:hypothetical protein